MSLSQQHRARIHDGLAPIVGTDAIEALLSEIPATDLDRPATEGFVRAEIADLRTEMRTEFASVRGEMRTEFASVRGEIADLRGETRAEFANLRGEIQGLRAEFADRFRSQTIWTASALTAGLALAAAIARLSG